MSQEVTIIKMLTNYGWFETKSTDDEAKKFIIDFLSKEQCKLAIPRGNHQKPIAAIIEKLFVNGKEIQKITEDK